MKDIEKIMQEELARLRQASQQQWQKELDEQITRVLTYCQNHRYFGQSKPPFDRPFVEMLIKTYGLDTLRTEFKKMTVWLMADPRRQKKNYRRFVVNWLNRRDLKVYLSPPENPE